MSNYAGASSATGVNLALLNGIHYAAAGCGGDDNTPTWNGCDVWDYEGRKDTPDGHSIDTREAYVNDQVLATTPDASITIALRSGDRLALTHAIITAKVVPFEGGPGFTLADGIITGSADPSELLRFFGDFDFNGVRLLCPAMDPADYENIYRPLICGAKDLPSSPTAAPNQRCDAISFSLHFGTTAPIMLGDAGPLPEAGDCPGIADAGCP